MTRRQRKCLYHALIIIGVGCLFTLLAFLARPFYSVNLWVSDQLFASEPPSPNIVIVGIDDDTLEKPTVRGHSGHAVSMPKLSLT